MLETEHHQIKKNQIRLFLFVVLVCLTEEIQTPSLAQNLLKGSGALWTRRSDQKKGATLLQNELLYRRTNMMQILLVQKLGRSRGLDLAFPDWSLVRYQPHSPSLLQLDVFSLCGKTPPDLPVFGTFPL